MLTPIGPDIWLADGPPIVAMMGFRYPTRMAVIRLADGGLLVWSPVALSAELKTEIAALGPVRHLLAPNNLHHMALGDWHAAWPEAALYAAPGLGAKRPDLVFTEELGATPPPAWSGQIDQVLLPSSIAPEIVLFHRPSGVVLFTDILQNMPRGWFSGWRALIARLDLMTEAEPTVPRKFRLATTDRQAARATVATILSWPVRLVVMAHGTPVTESAPAFLERAFAWLRP